MQLYDEDGDEFGNADDLLFASVAGFIIAKGWGAIIDAVRFG